MNVSIQGIMIDKGGQTWALSNIIQLYWYWYIIILSDCTIFLNAWNKIWYRPWKSLKTMLMSR